MAPGQPDSSALLRIGGVTYGVGAPFLGGLDDLPQVHHVRDHPTRLIAMLRDGELDAALVSSIEAICQPGYQVVAGLGIACRREIRSVRAFRRRGAQIRSVGLDQGSATSVALLRLLLRHVHRGEVAPDVRFAAIAPTLRPNELSHDLVLQIGDKGLHADPGGREVWDRGREWTTGTGLPFVVATWVLRAGAPVDALLPVLLHAREQGRALGAVDGTHGAAHYDLDAEDERGLERFWQECRDADLASEGNPPFVGARRN